MTDALALPPDQVQLAAFANFTDFAQKLAVLMGADLAVEQRAELHDTLGRYAEDMKRMADQVRGQMLEVILRDGNKVTDNGTIELQLNIGGQTYTKRASPTRTTTDPKKLLSLLMARGIKPADVMTPMTEWTVDPLRLAECVEAGILSAEDVERCKFDLSYRVTKLTKVKDEE